ncbi:MAG: helix-turn-helix domain-containing protein, partial [Dehalococcoidia bacterium]
LADQVGAARQTVSRILNEWRRQGLIDTGRGEIRILNPEELRRLSG